MLAGQATVHEPALAVANMTILKTSNTTCNVMEQYGAFITLLSLHGATKVL
jgi:hypothetical protein